MSTPAAEAKPLDAMRRALNMEEKYAELVLHPPDGVQWIEETDRFVGR